MSTLIASAASWRTRSTIARELGVVADRRAEQQSERGPVVGDEAEVGAEARLDPSRPVVARLVAAVISSSSWRADVLEQLDVERPLRREVLVQHRLGDARGLGDVVHRRAVEAAGGEHVARDVEKLPAPLLGRESHGHVGRGYCPTRDRPCDPVRCCS